MDSHEEGTLPLSGSSTAMDVLMAVEKDAVAVAEKLSHLMASLRTCLADASQNTIEHMDCHSKAADSLQEAVMEAASKGNRFVNECLRLNEEMRGITDMAFQIKKLRQKLDQFEAQASYYLPRGP